MTYLKLIFIVFIICEVTSSAPPIDPQTPKGKRVTGLMPDTAVRNNIYRRGNDVT